MMKKLSTKLQFFRFDSTNQEGPYNIIWYKLITNDDGDEEGVCLTMDELNQLTNFMLQKPANFLFGGKDYHDCSDDEAPLCSTGSLMPDEHRNFPDNLILRKRPHIILGGKQYLCADIILTDKNGADNHNYNLGFDVIGKIQL